ncbi:acyltransferase family protein [Sphingomonas aerophila]|uniref:Fucose 4-O-acetylase-like acetyltransferase n=1 Tax=Sphingomonas aerophila TaxID=1344948 RepID=A0A7W9BCQ9_9SPHN|nr:acyltransferase family protein [Sphingomonas aerophila]MBB5714768.1 fucose 4-O-acetylase-like acetyltransferase [Sphingomonas aerophila]
MNDLGFAAGASEVRKAGRLEWIDATKGLGIILLVVLHVEAVSDATLAAPIVWVLRLFRMPMFFIVAGLLFSPREPVTLARKKASSLLVPYVSYLTLIWAALALRYALLGVPSLYLTPAGIKAIIRGGERLNGEYGVFWFLTCLFFTQLTYNALIRRWGSPLKAQVIGTVLFLLLLGYALAWAKPWFAPPLALGIVPFGLPLFWFGNVLKVASPDPRKVVLGSVAVLAIGAVTWSLGIPLGMDMKYAEPGVPFLSIAVAMALTCLFFELMKPISKLPVVGARLAWLGEAAIVIMFLHQFVRRTFRAVGLDIDLALIVLGVAVPLAAYLIIERSRTLAPLFLGTAADRRSAV